MTNERLRQSIEQLTDHQRGCAGRDYTCTCGYEDARDSRLEAFKQEVSDAIAFALKVYAGHSGVLDPLKRFITPKPKPDPLVAVVYEVDNGPAWDSPEDYCNKIRAALEARGLEIREKGE